MKSKKGIFNVHSTSRTTSWNSQGCDKDMKQMHKKVIFIYLYYFEELQMKPKNMTTTQSKEIIEIIDLFLYFAVRIPIN